MFRSIPVQNKLCFQREHERNIQIHESKIRNMRKMIDNQAPQQFDFLANRKKKEALAQERGNEINRENMMLISKLSSILKRDSASRSQNPQQAAVNPHASAFSQTQGSSMFPGGGSKQLSLNKDSRKKEFVKIVIENQALLRRIQESKSEYNVKAWGKERQMNEKYISSISEYPYKDFKPNKTLIKLGVWHDPSNQNSGNNNKLTKRPSGKLRPLFKGSQNSKLIYKNGRKIGSFTYLIEIKVTEGKMEINLENLQKQAFVFNVELSEEEGMSILDNECGGDPELFIDRIRIDEKTNSFFFRRTNELRDNRKESDNHNSGQSGQNVDYQQDQLKVTEEKDEEEESTFQADHLQGSHYGENVPQVKNSESQTNLGIDNNKESARGDQKSINENEKGPQLKHQEMQSESLQQTNNIGIQSTKEKHIESEVKYLNDQTKLNSRGNEAIISEKGKEEGVQE